METISSQENTMFEDIFTTACKLPYCKIDRELFLTNQLKGKITSHQLSMALEKGTVNAGVPIKLLNSLAKGSINLETTKVTSISTAAGIPGGFAMVATIPADLAQFYAHVFRIAQKLAYIYGYKDVGFDDSTQGVLMIFLGVMFGVNAAIAGLAKLAAANAAKIGARVAAKPLTKYTIFNIAKKSLTWISVKLTKDIAGKAVSKAIPVIGGIISGGLTIATFLPMARKLENELSKLASMSPENLEKVDKEADIILAEYEVVSDEIVEEMVN